MPTVAEAAGRLECSVWTVHRLIKRGDLPARRVGGTYRVEAADLEAYLQASRVRKAPRPRRRRATPEVIQFFR